MSKFSLILLCAAQFMVILDITVVNIALPSIQQDLGLAAKDLQWVITAYTLAFGGLLLLGGRAADLFGRRRVFLTGLSVFTLASLGAALAGSPAALIAARVGQGVGAAMLSPAALSLVTTLHDEGPARHRALAAWAAVAASGGAVGVLLGGALTSALDWPAIFLINLPVGVAVAVGALRVLPAGEAPRREGRRARRAAGHRLAGGADLRARRGARRRLGLAQTLGLLAVALSASPPSRPSSRGSPRRCSRCSVFRRRPTVVALALMVAGMGTVMSSFFFLTTYLQEGLGHSALRTGLEFLPGAIVLVLAAHAGQHLVARHGAKPVLAGGMTLGAGGALLLSGLPVDGSYLADVLPGLLLLDVGIGLAASGIFITGMAGVGHARGRARLGPADDRARDRDRAGAARAVDDRRQRLARRRVPRGDGAAAARGAARAGRASGAPDVAPGSSAAFVH